MPTDRTIWAKSRHESASRIGQWVHDTLPATFDGIDVDFVSWKRSRRCLRFIEEKLAGESVYPSQKRILPVLAGIVAAGVRAGELARDSGVFVLQWWQTADAAATDESRFRVTEVAADGSARSRFCTGADAKRLAAGDQLVLDEFFRGQG